MSFNPGQEAAAENKQARLARDLVKDNANPTGLDSSYKDNFSEEQRDLNEMLYARHAEVESLNDLVDQRGTNIPALYNQVYRFIQNPSTVSVETFKRMIDTDETCGSGVDFLTTCLAARIGKYTHKSKEISEWVNARLNEIDGGWINTLKECLSASWAGFSVGEKVWANTVNGFVPKKIVQLPPGTIIFETERTGELTPDGILQYQRNYNPSLASTGAGYLFGFVSQSPSITSRPDIYAKLGDFPFPLRSPNIYSYLSIRIPTRKCIHYAFDAQGKFGSPYGRSLLRRAYKHWVVKDGILQMMSIALDRKGTPLQVWYVDPNATFIDPKQVQQGVDLTGQNVGVNAMKLAKAALKNVHNDSVVILPGKKGQFMEGDFINQQSNAQDFIAALNYADTRIMRALLLPALVMSGGDGAGSYALGQEHAKTFDKILDGVNSGFVQVLLRQLVREMIAYNFPRSAWEKDGIGEFGQRELSTEERKAEMECIETAVNLGAIDINDLNDLNQVRDKAGFAPRDEIIIKPLEMPMEGDDEEGGDPKDKKPKAEDKPKDKE